MEQTTTPEAAAQKQTQIAEYSETEASLAALRQKYGRAYDVTKPAEMAEARVARATLVSLRTTLEAKRKELKAPLLARAELFDTEAKRIKLEIVKLEEPIDAAILAEEERRKEAKAVIERATAARLSRAKEIAARFFAFPSSLIGATAPKIAEERDRLAGFDAKIEQEEGETHVADVEAARKEALAQLDKLYAATLAQEEAQRRIAQERAQLEADQKAAAKERADSEAKAAAERERVAAEERAAKERIAVEQRKADAARALADKEAAAVRERADRDAAAKIEAEEKRVAAEREKLEAQRRHQLQREEAERTAAEAKARKEREAKEEEERRAREVAEAKERDTQRARQKKLDARALLEDFVQRFGDLPEYKELAAIIVETIGTPPTKKGK